ncbi:MAG TPA: PqqD family protein [Planctomycetota bacterium]|nr:PqqD family protein [Planctomycetota bacterium]
MIPESARLALSEDVAHQSLGEGQDTVVLSLKSGYLYTCNETTQRFLEALDGRRTLGEVVDLLEGEFDVARATLAADLAALAEELLAEKLIVVRQEGE